MRSSSVFLIFFPFLGQVTATLAVAGSTFITDPPPPASHPWVVDISGGPAISRGEVSHPRRIEAWRPSIGAQVSSSIQYDWGDWGVQLGTRGSMFKNSDKITSSEVVAGVQADVYGKYDLRWTQVSPEVKLTRRIKTPWSLTIDTSAVLGLSVLHADYQSKFDEASTTQSVLSALGELSPRPLTAAERAMVSERAQHLRSRFENSERETGVWGVPGGEVSLAWTPVDQVQLRASSGLGLPVSHSGDLGEALSVGLSSRVYVTPRFYFETGLTAYRENLKVASSRFSQDVLAPFVKGAVRF